MCPEGTTNGMAERKLLTSESVTEGHPDKICDQVSDAILDAILAKDPGARVACETLTKTGYVMIAGEITTSARVDMPSLVRETIKVASVEHKLLDGNVDADRSVMLTALPLILDGLKAKSLQPVRLDQLLSKPGYVPCRPGG